jgi:hypothetical protein
VDTQCGGIERNFIEMAGGIESAGTAEGDEHSNEERK